MYLIAQNNFQLIVEFGFLLTIGVILLLNIVPLSLSFVLLIALIISICLTLLFGFDAVSLVLGYSNYEFTHPYGSIALFSIVTCLTAIYMMDDLNLNNRKIKIFIILLVIIIALVGGTVHRDFLGMWILGLVIGLFLLSKSFRRKTVLTLKNIVLVIIITLGAFGFFQAVSVILNLTVISPFLRLIRIDQNSVTSITMVLHNTYLIGHNPLSAYLVNSTGFAEGYVSLPLTLIKLLGLPFPEFYGTLVNKKDVIDYFVPGVLGYGYDFGYIIMILFLMYVVGVVLIGLKILKKYRSNRENGKKIYWEKRLYL